MVIFSQFFLCFFVDFWSLVLFFEMEKGPMWVMFSQLFCVFSLIFGAWRSFFDDFGVLGSSLDVFGAEGGPGRRPCGTIRN